MTQCEYSTKVPHTQHTNSGLSASPQWAIVWPNKNLQAKCLFMSSPSSDSMCNETGLVWKRAGDRNRGDKQWKLAISQSSLTCSGFQSFYFWRWGGVYDCWYHSYLRVSTDTFPIINQWKVHWISQNNLTLAEVGRLSISTESPPPLSRSILILCQNTGSQPYC